MVYSFQILFRLSSILEKWFILFSFYFFKIFIFVFDGVFVIHEWIRTRLRGHDVMLTMRFFFAANKRGGLSWRQASAPL